MSGALTRIDTTPLQTPQNTKRSYVPGALIVAALTIIEVFALEYGTSLKSGYTALIGGATFVVGQYLNGRIVAWLNNENPFWRSQDKERQGGGYEQFVNDGHRSGIMV